MPQDKPKKKKPAVRVSKPLATSPNLNVGAIVGAVKPRPLSAAQIKKGSKSMEGLVPRAKRPNQGAKKKK